MWIIFSTHRLVSDREHYKEKTKKQKQTKNGLFAGCKLGRIRCEAEFKLNMLKIKYAVVCKK